ncbi:LutC/YkgG family protein [Pedobacter gandavensis]|uniref:Lactate utilization protein B/C n=1 Tax=Pedobacter gandavensis TaxID=2679963 RepID=A0ABR6EUU2_9SPHI|nr:LUD domain-containing protein [Pedobacter gandavensis]MBB2149031.1 lactate utilization protein B/C [Pedobacter gandavensis]
MSSREEILARVKKNQPPLTVLPADLTALIQYPNPMEMFGIVLDGIGGTMYPVKDYEEMIGLIKTQFSNLPRVISTIPELKELTEKNWEGQDPHSYENVDVAIIEAHFGVAENAALWFTESLMGQRVIPFICQQLVVVVHKKDILSNMQEAYQQIADSSYGFGAFIAGPSKTADIEQSLVLGAHGPKNMTVFVLA